MKGLKLILISLFLSTSFTYSQTITTSSPGNSSYCQGDEVWLSYTVSSGFNSGNIFYAELSDENGSFANPDTIGSITDMWSNSIQSYFPTPLGTSGSGYRVRVVSTSPAVIGSDNGTDFAISGTSVDTTVMGNNTWNVYCFDDFNFSEYIGFYEDTTLNISTSNLWNINGSPDDYSGYEGCTYSSNDQFSFIYKRTGFPCGNYTLNVMGDDHHEIYLDGTLIYSGNYTSTVNNAVWTGELTPTSDIRIQVQENGGGAQLEVEFIRSSPISVSTSVGACPGQTLIIGASGGTSYDWSTNTTNMTAPYNTDSVEITIPGGTTVGSTYEYIVLSTASGYSCTFEDTVTVTIGDTVNVTASVDSVSTCPGTAVNVTASGANAYSWTPATNITYNNAAYSDVDLSPTTSTLYKVYGSGSCASDTAYVYVELPEDTSVYPQDAWNLYAFNGNNFNTYAGYYSTSTSNFSTLSDWNNNNSPSSATGYFGCTVNSNDHSFIVKRKGFDCGYYQISIPSHDDAVRLYVDGVLAYSNNNWFSNNPVVNAWSGYLNEDSEIRATIREYTGGSQLEITLIPLIGPSHSSNEKVWDGTVSNVWSLATNWCGGVPTASDHAIITDNGFSPQLFAAQEVDSLTVESGATLNILTLSLTVNEAINNEGTINVSATGNLVQTHSGGDINSGSGTYNIEQIGRIGTAGYNAWSSPIQNAGIISTFSGANPCDIFVFDETVQDWRYDYADGFSTTCDGNPVTFSSTYLISGGDGVMDVARGYFIPGGSNLTQTTRTFSGDVNNGDITFSLQQQPNPGDTSWTGDDWNLVGNPYPSAISASLFWQENATSNSRLTSAIYYWDDNGTIQNSQTEFAAWNSSGTTQGPNSLVTPNGAIAVGQGFYVKANQEANLVFNNSMRNTSNSQFFKQVDQADFTQFWFKLETPTAASNQLLIAFPQQATEDFDPLYDAVVLDDGYGTSLAALIQNDAFVIEGKAPLYVNQYAHSPLKVNGKESGEYVIQLMDQNLGEGIDVFLIDHENNSRNDLKELAYTFQVSDSLNTAERFELEFFKREEPTGVDQIDDNEYVKAYFTQGVIQIESNIEFDNVTVYGIDGKQMISSQTGLSYRHSIGVESWVTGVYIVDILDVNEKHHRKKLIIQ